jgi:hypothetical protein
MLLKPLRQSQKAGQAAARAGELLLVHPNCLINHEKIISGVINQKAVFLILVKII